VAALAFGAGSTIPVPWFVNDPDGVFYFDFDTWLTLKNNTQDYITLTLDYYDDSNFFSECTIDTVAVPPKGVSAVFTGIPAYDEDLTWLGPGFHLGAACDRGSINVRWPKVTVKARQAIAGYESIHDYVAAHGLGINLVYTDD
jgi:hypothetical protein